MSQVSIIGAYNSKFGSFVQKNRETGEITDLKSVYELMIEAGRGALADAGIQGKDVDGVWVGSCAPGLFANQEHLASFATEIDPEGLAAFLVLGEHFSDTTLLRGVKVAPAALIC